MEGHIQLQSRTFSTTSLDAGKCAVSAQQVKQEDSQESVESLDDMTKKLEDPCSVYKPLGNPRQTLRI